jgi:diaminopimelate decarboxylase
MSFHFKDGTLYCEELSVKDIQENVRSSPFYLYSLRQIRDNFKQYESALSGLPSIISYAFKANSNLTILKRLRMLGCGATLVSGNELKLAAAAGFDPRLTIFNGNGKTMEELELAALQGVMVNVDSEFDLRHIEQAAKMTGRSVDLLIRVNPGLDPGVHPHIATGVRESKFGIPGDRLPRFLDFIKASAMLNLVGIHYHLGSTIKEVQVFREATGSIARIIEAVRQDGWDLKFMNIGGGLGIDYEQGAGTPGPADLVSAIRDLVPEDMTLIVEPGRSIVGSAGTLISRVIGVKSGENKNFIVVDGSMAELLRPSLYGAHHRIGFIEPESGPEKRYDIVGPVCESGDFLGKDRYLATPGEGAGLAVFDAGAYGYVMSSNYNARMRPPEYLVDGEDLTMIRRAERFEDYLRLFELDAAL